MSYMSIDINSLKDIEKRVNSLSKGLGEIRSSLSTVRSNIDSTVRNRSGIDSSMSSLIREVGERERIMNNVKQFLKEAVKQYEDMEKALKGESDRIIANSAPKTGIIKSILNGLKSIGKKLGNLLKTIAKNSILLSPVIIGTPVVIIGKILAERGFIVTNEPTEIIKKNDKGIPILEGILSYSPFEFNPYVVLLQKRLIELGYGDGLEVNGIFDSKTLEAVNKYKEDYGLWNHDEYEGKVGETTWNHLFKNQKVPFVGGTTNELIKDSDKGNAGNQGSNRGINSEKLFKYIDEYINFTVDGYPVDIPYYITQTVSNGTKLYGGKATPEQIRAYIKNQTAIPGNYQSVADKNKQYTGIDCSGFVAYVLNEVSGGAVLNNWKTTYANGISADALTNPKNGTQITRAKDIVPGATIGTHMKNGVVGHVLVVYDVVRNSEGKVIEIKYAHSSSSKNGPTLGTITIGDENQDLGHSSQIWNNDNYRSSYVRTVLLDCINVDGVNKNDLIPETSINSHLFQDAIRGVSGDAVTIEGQAYLSLMGFPVGTYGPNKNGVDGQWGNMSQASTKLFQQIMGLPQTGNLDSNTLKKMRECFESGKSLKQLAIEAYNRGVRPGFTSTSTQAERVNTVYFYALINEEKSGVPAAITVAQAIQESSAGAAVPIDIYTGEYSYNIFGIKANSKWLNNGGDYVTAKTWEEENGRKYTTEAKFRKYNSYLESIEDHAKFLTENDRYSFLFDLKKDDNYLENWAKGLKSAGYATDSEYAVNLIRHINTYGLK
jgi:peptidoglycan hydrolase-like protein with peptidoglycan-binding domain